MSRLLSSLFVALALSLFAVVVLPPSPQVAGGGGDVVAAVPAPDLPEEAEAPGSSAAEAEAMVAFDLRPVSGFVGRPGRAGGARSPVEAASAQPAPPPRAAV